MTHGPADSLALQSRSEQPHVEILSRLPGPVQTRITRVSYLIVAAVGLVALLAVVGLHSRRQAPEPAGG